jgi:hypothetical protein
MKLVWSVMSVSDATLAERFLEATDRTPRKSLASGFDVATTCSFLNDSGLDTISFNVTFDRIRQRFAH